MLKHNSAHFHIVLLHSTDVKSPLLMETSSRRFFLKVIKGDNFENILYAPKHKANVKKCTCVAAEAVTVYYPQSHTNLLFLKSINPICSDFHTSMARDVQAKSISC